MWPWPWPLPYIGKISSVTLGLLITFLPSEVRHVLLLYLLLLCHHTLWIPYKKVTAGATGIPRNAPLYLIICCEICKTSFYICIEVNVKHRDCPPNVMTQNTEYSDFIVIVIYDVTSRRLQECMKYEFFFFFLVMFLLSLRSTHLRLVKIPNLFVKSDPILLKLLWLYLTVLKTNAVNFCIHYH